MELITSLRSSSSRTSLVWACCIHQGLTLWTLVDERSKARVFRGHVMKWCFSYLFVSCCGKLHGVSLHRGGKPVFRHQTLESATSEPEASNTDQPGRTRNAGTQGTPLASRPHLDVRGGRFRASDRFSLSGLHTVALFPAGAPFADSPPKTPG